MGLFVVSRKYLQDYALLSRPMTEILKGKPPTFRWGPDQQTAFDTIRDRLLEGVHLAAPNFALPFHLATDASEDGKGGELYQLPDIPVSEQYPYDPKIQPRPGKPRRHLFLVEGFRRDSETPPPILLGGRFVVVMHVEEQVLRAQLALSSLHLLRPHAFAMDGKDGERAD